MPLRLTRKMSSVAVRRDDLHQLVAVLQVHGDEPGTQRRVVLGELRLLHLPLLRAEEEVPVGLVVARVDDRLDRLTRLQRQQVHDGGAASRALLHRDLVRLQPVHAASAREEQQIRVRGRVDDVGDVVLVAELGARHTSATAPLGAEHVGGHRLHVALGRHGDHELFVLDEVLDVEIADVERDLTAAGVGELLTDLAHLVLDDAAQAAVVGQDRLQLRDLLAQRGQLLLEVRATEAGEARQRHLEDVLGLQQAELERRGLQTRRAPPACRPTRGWWRSPRRACRGP